MATSLIELLDLARADDTTFIGPASHEPHIRAFGGHVAAQALVAAGRTVSPERVAHSLHSYFLRPGAPDEPIVYSVGLVRDGRSFSTRHVEASQQDQVIFDLSASFHIAEPGPEHTTEPPSAPLPDSLQPFEERFAGRESSDMARWFARARDFDIRYVRDTPFDPPSGGHEAHQQVWIKTAAPLPDDPLLHHAVLDVASDMTVLDAVLLRHGVRWTDRKLLGASLDHALWFHQPLRVDEWLLFDEESPTAHGGRGLATGHVWTADGRLVASVVQEALLRPPISDASHSR